MTTIREFVEKSIFLPTSPLNISRSVMPQITKNGYEDFLGFLKENGVDYKEKSVPILSLNASQANFDLGKIKARIGKNSTNERPLLTSKDKYILDGHHRWIAEVNSKKKEIDVIEIDLPIMELINLARTHDGVHFRDVNDKTQTIQKVKSAIFANNK